MGRASMSVNLHRKCRELVPLVVVAVMLLAAPSTRLNLDGLTWPRGTLQSGAQDGHSLGDSPDPAGARRLEEGSDDDDSGAKGGYLAAWIVFATLGGCCLCGIKVKMSADEGGEPDNSVMGLCCCACCMLIGFVIFLVLWITTGDGGAASAVAQDQVVTELGCRVTEARCLPDWSSSVAYFEACDTEALGKQVVCDIQSIGDEVVSGGRCICPEGWCFQSGKCQPTAAANLSWQFNSTLSERLDIARQHDGEGRKRMIFNAVDECQGLPYRQGINTVVNLHLTDCAFTQKLLETCGVDATEFYLRELRDGGGLGKFLIVALKGVLIGAAAKLVAAVVVLYFATALLRERASVLYEQAEEGGSDEEAGDSVQSCNCCLFAFVKLFCALVGAFTCVQLFWIAMVNTYLAWKINHEYMQSITDFVGPCDFYFASRFLDYPNQAEVLGLCFVSWFDAITWFILVTWSFLLCCSHCCYCCFCNISYICCCVCCKTCSCSCLCAMLCAGLCSTMMWMILAIPLLLVTLGVCVCIVVWAILALLATAVACVVLIAVLTLVAVCLYAFARVMAAALRREWGFTFWSFMNMWKDHTYAMCVLILGIAHLVGDDEIQLELCPSGSVHEKLKKALKLLRLGVVWAVIIPVVAMLVLVLVQLSSTLSFNAFVSAQVDMTDFMYPHPDAYSEYSYDIGGSWTKNFEQTFPSLVRQMYAEFLPVLFAEVPKSIIESMTSINPSMPDFGALLVAGYDSLMRIVTATVLDIEELIDINYWLRVALVFLESVFLLLYVMAHHIQTAGASIGLPAPAVKMSPAIMGSCCPKEDVQEKDAPKLTSGTSNTSLGDASKMADEFTEATAEEILELMGALKDELLAEVRDDVGKAFASKNKSLFDKAKEKFAGKIKGYLRRFNVPAHTCDKVCEDIQDEKKVSFCQLLRDMSDALSDLKDGEPPHRVAMALVESDTFQSVLTLLAEGCLERVGLRLPEKTLEPVEAEEKANFVRTVLTKGQEQAPDVVKFGKHVCEVSELNPWEDMLKPLAQNCFEAVGVRGLAASDPGKHEGTKRWEIVETCVSFFILPNADLLRKISDSLGVADYAASVLRPMFQAALAKAGVSEKAAADAAETAAQAATTEDVAKLISAVTKEDGEVALDATKALMEHLGVDIKAKE